MKLSGEAMAGGAGFGIDFGTVEALAREIAAVSRAGIELGIVVGGGNIFRGASTAAGRMDRVTADQMGMLATVINALALQDALEHEGIPTRVMSALEMRQVAEPYIRRRALVHLEKGRVMVFAGGTSNPYFSTDSAASLRALEIRADVMAKATRVDGVYDKDPLRHPDATLYRDVTFQEFLAKGLGVMDGAAVAMCRDNHLPIVVFNLAPGGNIMRMAMGEPIGTVVHA